MLFKQIATLAMCLLGAVKAYQEADAYTYINHPSTNEISNHHITPLRRQAVNLLANLGQDRLLALLSLVSCTKDINKVHCTLSRTAVLLRKELKIFRVGKLKVYFFKMDSPAAIFQKSSCHI